MPSNLVHLNWVYFFFASKNGPSCKKHLGDKKFPQQQLAAAAEPPSLSFNVLWWADFFGVVDLVESYTFDWRKVQSIPEKLRYIAWLEKMDPDWVDVFRFKAWGYSSRLCSFYQRVPAFYRDFGSMDQVK